MSATSISCEQVHPSLSVEDIEGAVDFYTGKLGFVLAFKWGDPPAMAGVNLGNVQLFLDKGTPNPAGWSVYFVVDDVDALHAHHRARGVDVLAPPDDKPWGMRQYAVRDLHGHELLFGQHLPSAEPKLPIERVDVAVRLERRLAAALADLAAMKRMTVGECLEETLLHTFAGVGPHTEGQLRRIEELKAKHGIDYDSHASYRFVEPIK